METSRTVGHSRPGSQVEGAPGDPCILVIFGASGDLTKRLLVPALYNLTCDGLLPERFAVVGIAMDPLTTEGFRARMAEDIRSFNTRKELDPAAWARLESQLHYTPGNFGDESAYMRLHELVATLDAVDPELPAWNFAPQAKKAAFWHRRMAHETAIHRWDAQMAGGLAENASMLVGFQYLILVAAGFYALSLVAGLSRSSWLQQVRDWTPKRPADPQPALAGQASVARAAR